MARCVFEEILIAFILENKLILTQKLCYFISILFIRSLWNSLGVQRVILWTAWEVDSVILLALVSKELFVEFLTAYGFF